jgi:hypothetical protein
VETDANLARVNYGAAGGKKDQHQCDASSGNSQNSVILFHRSSINIVCVGKDTKNFLYSPNKIAESSK